MVDAIKVDGRKGNGPKGGKQNGGKNGKFTISVDRDIYNIITALGHFSGNSMGYIVLVAVREYSNKYSKDIVEQYHRHVQEEKALKEKYLKQVVVPVAINTTYDDYDAI